MHARFCLALALAGTPSLALAQASQQWPGVVLYDSKGVALGTVGNPVNMTAAPTASAVGGLNVYRVMATATTNGTAVKSSAGKIYAYTFCNTAGTARYVRLYNLPAAPSPGTSPIYAGAIPVTAGACQHFSNDIGLSFSAGIGFSITGANGDTDATAVAAGDVSGFIGYQ
jgi:hypothetical protein